MIRNYAKAALLISAMATGGASHAREELPVLEGPYLGQTPPGSTAKPFAPGIVNTEDWGDAGGFSLDMNEFYVTRWRVENEKRETESVTYKRVGDRWHEVAVPDGTRRPFHSPDGKTLHYGAEYRERTADGWSEMKSLGSAFEEIRIMGLTASRKGTLVLDEVGTDGDGVIRYSRLVDGKREEPKPFGKEINTGTWNAHPYIAPDESYIMWDGERESGYGSSDLYISFRQPDGSWGEAINLGDTVNTEAEEGGPKVTPDGKYLFFNRMVPAASGDTDRQSDLFWIDAQIIEALRPKPNDGLAPEATADVATLSFRDIPYLDEAFIDATPADRNDAISVGELGVDGGNKDMIVGLAQEIADNKHGNFDSLLISHQGKLLFESYYLRGRINLPHPQASATKAYTSLAIGRAIQLGYMTMDDLDKPLVSFLKDLDPAKFVEGTENITLNKAMTMRSGIRIAEEKMDELMNNPGQFQLEGQGQIQAFLEHSAPISSESQSFNYQGTDPTLAMQVLDAVVPGTAEDFIKDELLDKMGITTYGWQTGVSGLPEAGWRVSMTSRDMVKWGTLAMNKGKWNGEQLVPEAFIAKATSKIAQPTDDWEVPPGTAYGYFWWQFDLKADNKSYLGKTAWGGGAQYIMVIDDLDLVVVATAHTRDDDTASLIAERILPAFIQ